MMRTAARALSALLLALCPLPALAQEGEAWVLPPGFARLRAGGEFARFDTRFAPGGGTEPLAAGLAGPLDSRTFAPIRPLEDRLNAFLRASDPAGPPVVAGPSNLNLGTADLRAAANTRVAPLSITLGVLPRVELFAEVPILREEVLYTRAGLVDGTVGINPDTAGNAAILAALGAEGRAVGASPLLPYDSSALGRELQRRVREALPSASLNLPEAPASFAELNDLLDSRFGVAPLVSGVRAYRVGDASVGARVLLLSSLGSAPFPEDSAALHYRLAATGSLRLPTGAAPDTVQLLGFQPEVGLGGVGAGLDADLFLGARAWATASLRYESLGSADVLRRVVDPSAPLTDTAAARSVRWSPGARLSLRVAPRYRLTDAISLGATYTLAQIGESSFEGAALLDEAAGTVQTVGLHARYSTLPAYWEGRGLLPVDVSVGYQRTLDGPAGAPGASAAVIQASLFQRVWGGAGRR